MSNQQWARAQQTEKTWELEGGAVALIGDDVWIYDAEKKQEIPLTGLDRLLAGQVLERLYRFESIVKKVAATDYDALFGKAMVVWEQFRDCVDRARSALAPKA